MYSDNIAYRSLKMTFIFSLGMVYKIFRNLFSVCRVMGFQLPSGEPRMQTFGISYLQLQKTKQKTFSFRTFTLENPVNVIFHYVLASHLCRTAVAGK